MSAGPRSAMPNPWVLILACCIASGAAAAVDETPLAKAREAAAANQHRRAAGLYEEAFSAHPALADSFAAELGTQLSFDDRAGEAIPWYERRLEASPLDLEARLGLARALSWNDQLEEASFQYRVVYYLDEGNLEARRGEARMLAWQDRLDEALAKYDAILADHPDDVWTRIERAQVVNWRGEHFRAARLYEEVLADDPGNAEAMVGLAQALRWSGQDWAAMSTLDPIRENPSAAPVYRDLEFAARPWIEAGAGWSEDTDDLQVLTTELAWNGTTGLDFLRKPRARLSLLHESLWQPGQPDVEVWGFGAGGAGKTSLRTTLNAYLTVKNFRSDGTLVNSGQTGDLDWTTLAWDAWWTWLARYDLRVDLATDRNYVQTPRAIGYTTTLTRIGASADWKLDRRWTLSGLLRQGFYSDDNRRTEALVRARWERNRGFRFWVSPRLSGFWISEPMDRGYWNPEDFAAAGVDVGISRTWARVFTPRLELSAAREWEEGVGYGVGAVSGGILWRFARAWELDLGAGTSDSRLSTSSGYARDWASLLLRWRY